jgi:hypothetical protein
MGWVWEVKIGPIRKVLPASPVVPCHTNDVEQFQIIPDGPKAFAVEITFHSGRTEIRRGFRTKADAESWMEKERVKAASAARMPIPNRPR